jgi:hypothetical protein
MANLDFLFPTLGWLTRSQVSEYGTVDRECQRKSSCQVKFPPHNRLGSAHAILAKTSKHLLLNVTEPSQRLVVDGHWGK